jgi:hypothetical protein
MKTPFTRRHFIRATSALAGLATAPRWLPAATPARGAFSFVLLGDLHFDRLEHHDMAWLEKAQPNDVRQVQNYTRITREITPQLLATVRTTLRELNRTGGGPRAAFVLQVGDLVEGLCGTEALALRHNADAVAFLEEAKLGAPFLFTKGNHDITGPGAVPAFGSVFHPFLTAQTRALSATAPEVTSARYTVEWGNAQFAFFDAYESAASLAWFEAVAAKRTAEHLFVVVHPPVVPYGARSTWHLFANARDKARREKFLSLLGDQGAIVLGGHIHKFNALTRAAGRGRFTQLAISSIISGATVKAKDLLSGVDAYTGDQIRVEPNFSPANEAERRAVYDAERPFVSAFEYGDLPGYGIVTVDGARVTARIFSGISRELWRTVELTPAPAKAG